MKVKQTIVRYLGITLTAISFFACKEPYTPPQIENNPNYLVVDGMLNVGDSTTIKLSRTRSFTDSVSQSPENGATVTVVGDGGDSYLLSDRGNGIYNINYLPLNPTEKYTLRIATLDGKQYESDAVSIKQTQAIDSVNWIQNGDGVQVYVNTHDPNNSSIYYRWTYEETWEYRAKFASYLIYKDGGLQPRSPDEDYYTCWQSRSSTELVLASTAGLSDDIVYRAPVQFIESGSTKISRLYSILVKQAALTKEAYEYWEQLKKSTELSGGLFDPLPSQIIGNMHCINDANAKALGYISASTITEQRIYINNTQLAPPWILPVQDCPEVVVPPDSVDYYFGKYILIPIGSHGLSDYSGSYSTCIDCRTYGGTTTKPPYWP